MKSNVKDNLDLLWGVKSIAEFIGKSHQATYKMMVAGKIPAKQVGSQWVASRSELTKFFACEVAA